MSRQIPVLVLFALTLAFAAMLVSAIIFNLKAGTKYRNALAGGDAEPDAPTVPRHRRRDGDRRVPSAVAAYRPV